MTVSSVLWRRLDTPGHDACRLEEREVGWTLDGIAVFLENGAAARLAYNVQCDPGWHTRQGQVRGWLGGKPVRFDMVRSSEGMWTLNAAAIPGLESCIDLDFGFTPATNLLPLRRLDLAVGQAADAPAAWLDVSSGTLQLLPQRYEKRVGGAYWYQAPRFGYEALLEVDPSGFILRYPGLWEAER